MSKAKPSKESEDMNESSTIAACSAPPPPPNRLQSVVEDPPRQNVLLLTCMDQRLLDDIVKYMNGLNLHNRYDQVALAGGAMGALQLPKPNVPDKQRWREVFFAHLHAAIETLHRPIKDIFLLDHLDCGAYKYLHPDDHVTKEYPHSDREKMTNFHRVELNKFAWEVYDFIDDRHKQAEAEFESARKACGKKEKCWEKICELAEIKAEAWVDIRISYFVMDLLGVVNQLDLPIGSKSTLLDQ